MREPTLRESVVMDRVFAPHAFHELASIVEESTLSSSLPPIERREISDDEKLVRHLGANGLRFAFEVCNDDGITHPDYLDKVYQIITDPESLTDEIRYPHAYIRHSGQEWIPRKEPSHEHK